MRSESEIREMARTALRESGWNPEDMTKLPPPVDDAEAVARTYAAGVEAGLVWAMGDASSPFPR